MELVTLHSEKVKYSINDDGTLMIRIGKDFILKISQAELMSFSILTIQNQMENLGMAKSIVEEIQKKLITQPPVKETLKDSSENIESFQKFLESYLTQKGQYEVFLFEELQLILEKTNLTIEKIKTIFQESYLFETIENDQTKITRL